MSYARRTNSRRGFSLIELLIVIAIILIIITMAVPQYNKVQMYTRETAAIKAVQTVRDMQVQYQSQYGRFAKSLTELGPPPGGGASTPASAGLIQTDLALGEKGGYKFAVTGDGSGYAVTATPITYGTSGSRSFYMDQNMVMKEHYGPEPATPNDKELGQAQK
jgi:type IV pilus assembly protein PilA